MHDLDSKKIKLFLKRYAPVSVFVLLTIVLMIFFRMNKKNISSLIEKGKDNLISFYAQNLKPLLTRTEISNEDVFNFALYQSIPIDKENKKVLIISNQQNGNQVYEIKPVELNTDTDNYSRFIDFMELTPSQRLKADSILNSYKRELNLSVFTNEKNTIAVNPKISDLQKAVLADLLNFANDVNAQKASEIFPTLFSNLEENQLAAFAHSTKEFPQNEYIFFTPDTVFKSLGKINNEEYWKKLDEKMFEKALTMNEINEVKLDIDTDIEIEKNMKIAQKVITMALDTNFYYAVIPSIPNVHLGLSNDSLRIKLDKVTEKLKDLAVSSSKNANNEKKQNIPKVPPIPKKPIEFQFNYSNPTDIAKQALEMVSKQNIKDWDKFGAKMDSFGRALEDSIKKSMKLNSDWNKVRTKSSTKSAATDSVIKK